MRVFHLLVALGLVLSLATAAPAAGKGKKNKKAATVAGVVQSVSDGSITIKPGKGKKNAAAAGDQTIKLTAATKYETATVAKGDKAAAKGKSAPQNTQAATRDSVKTGGHVLVTHRGGVAEKVVVLTGGKKAKKKARANG
jgi:hypothetical protein